MIVADTNLLAYLLIPGERTAAAREVLRIDPDWRAPRLWRSELRNVLVAYVRAGALSLPDAVALMGRGERALEGREHEVASASVLSLAAERGVSAYDGEFALLALVLRAPLVTSDQRLRDAFPDVAIPPERFVEMRGG